MTYLTPDSKYSEFWVIEGTQVPPNLVFQIKDTTLDIYFNANVISEETTEQYINRVLKQFADSSNIKFQDLNLKFNDEFNKSIYVATDYANKQINRLEYVLNLFNDEFIAKTDVLLSELQKVNLTETNISQILTEYSADENSQHVQDILTNVQVHSLQNDANGNYFELKFPKVSAGGKIVNINDIHDDFIKVIVNNGIGAEASKIIKTIDSLKIYFVTKGIHLKPFDYKINDVRYGKNFDFDIEIYRKKLGA